MIAFTALILYLAAPALAVQSVRPNSKPSPNQPKRLELPRSYAHRLTLARWHSEQEWRALDTIIRRESNWNPCAHWMHAHDCGYMGSNSCGIPQANPCPQNWRGRLWSTRFRQVDWLISYVRGRYGSPSAALAYWNGHQSY